MSQNKQNFYDTCRDCQYAEFLDFETVKCGKSVVFEPDTECAEFQDVGHASSPKEVTNVMTLAEDVEEILEVEKEYTIQELKKEEESEIVQLSEIEINEEGETIERQSPLIIEQDYRLLTKEEVNVYKTSRTRSQDVIRAEPKDQLIQFHRQVIRHGDELFQLLEPNGEKSYIRYHERKTSICEQAVVDKNPLDILLMSHQDFDLFTDKNTKIKSDRIKKEYGDHLHSQVKTVNRKTIARIKDVYSTDGQKVTMMNNYTFNGIVPDIKIGRLESGTSFYITAPTIDSRGRKIKLVDGTEGVLLSRSEAYKTVETKLEAFVSTLSKILFVVIILMGIGAVLLQTGYLVIIGILIIPLAFIIMIFFSLPLYFILSQIVRRF